MSKNIKTDDGNVEFEVCHLGVNVTDHHEQEAIWARLSDAQRVELAAALDPGRRGLHVRLDNQAASLATLQRERDEADRRTADAEADRDKWKLHHDRVDGQWAKSEREVTKLHLDLERVARERDEALRKKGEMVDRAVRAERERDAAVARAEGIDRDYRECQESLIEVSLERDEWKARADQADPVEAKAREAFGIVHEDAAAWRDQSNSVQESFRRLARHVLGQEATR